MIVSNNKSVLTLRNNQLSTDKSKGKFLKNNYFNYAEATPSAYSYDISSKLIYSYGIMSSLKLHNKSIPAFGLKYVHIPKPFEDSDKKLTLDTYQKQAIDAFKEGKTVIVTAPTGTGKTLIAEYGIEEAKKTGKSIIYLAPLKALSNEKFNKFGELFGTYDELGKLIGKENVGIVTGDVKINENAPITVMTTECYRNMVTTGNEKEISDRLKNVKGVIFDEFHYLNDPDRGTMWEESIMFSPPNVQFMMLSATASNADQIKGWLESINKKKSVELVNVPENERHVPLKYYTYAKNVNSSEPELIDLLETKININKLNNQDTSLRVKESLNEIARKYNKDLRNAPENKVFSEEGLDVLKTKFLDITDGHGKIDSEMLIKKLKGDGFKKEKAEQIALRLSDSTTRSLNPELDDYEPTDGPTIVPLLEELNAQDKLPALFFVFSKHGCKTSMEQASKKMGQLVTDEQRQEILERIEECERNGVLLGKDFNSVYKPALLNGFAVHHAGMLPAYKSLVEELFRDKLLKAAFATETLVAGINMPVKTVVVTGTEKMTSDGMKEISPSLFKQGSGRAGRRGIDDIGYVVVLPKDKKSYSQAFKFITSESDKLNSQLKLSYNLLLSPKILNNIENGLDKSFACYQSGNSKKYIEQSKKMNTLMSDRGFIRRNKEADDNRYEVLPKGEISAKIAGINEIFLTEIITDEKIIKDIKPSNLAGLVAIFMDKEIRNESKVKYPKTSRGWQDKAQRAVDIANSINKHQERYEIDKTININTKMGPVIQRWAECPKDKSIGSWISTINNFSNQEILMDEGDFLKVVNSTIDVLKQIVDASPDTKLVKTAKEAIVMLQKPPVVDVLKQELGEHVLDEITKNTDSI